MFSLSISHTKAVHTLGLVLSLFLFSNSALACPDIDGLVDVNCDGELNILAFGDSITAGSDGDATGGGCDFGSGGRCDSMGGYPGRLQTLLPNSSVVNLGISGERTDQAANRSVSTFASANAPDYIILHEGVNDISRANNDLVTPLESADNLRQVVQDGEDAGARVLWANLTSATRVLADSSLPYPTFQDWVDEINLQISGETSIDFSGLGTTILGEDGLHPNGDGYQAMALRAKRDLESFSNSNRPADTDNDGVYDFAEPSFGTIVGDSDTDNDGLLDGYEIFVSGTSPSNPDTNGDGINDGQDNTNDFSLRINAGGNAFTDSFGYSWVADQSFIGGNTYSTTSGISGTSDDELYQTERYGNPFSYEIAVPNGEYEVTFHFAEIFATSANSRLFDVSLEGVIAQSDIDLFAEAGSNAPVTLFETVIVSDGSLSVDLAASLNFAKLSGIEIQNSGGTSPTTTTTTTTSTTTTTLPPVSSSSSSSSSGTGFVVRINSGGDSFTDSNGYTWQADTSYSGGNPFSASTPIAGTVDDLLYQSERWGNPYSYNIDLPNDTYEVRLHFAEIFATSAGQRLMDIAVEGNLFLSSFDLFAEAGANTSYIVNSSVTVTDGQLNIDLSASANNAKLSGLEVLGSGTGGGTTTTTTTLTTSTTTTTSPPVSSSSSSSSSGTNNFALRVNAGGSDHVDAQGNQWIADTAYSGGNAFSSSAPIAGTTDDVIYQTERWGNPFSYSVAVPNGDYTVILHFSEIFATAASSRILDVELENTLVLDDFDLFAASGANNAHIDTISTSVTDGEINILLNASVNNAKLSGFEILSDTGVSSSSSTSTSGTTTTTTTTTIPVSSSSSSSSGGNNFNLRINSGGSELVDSSGNSWVADTAFSGGNPFSTNSTISGTSDQGIYQTERYGNPFSYNVAVPNGDYFITLHFAEIFATSANSRIMNVSAEGQSLVSDFDLFSVAGSNSAYTSSFSLSVSDGELNITLDASSNNAKISGIEISSGPDSSSSSSSSSSGTTTTTTTTVSTTTTSSTTTTVPGGTGYSLRINSGGDSFTATDGNVWLADTYFSGGNNYSSSNSIDGSSEQGLYQTERYGNPFSYNIPLGNGVYSLTLHFAEVYATGTSQRVMSVDVEGYRTISNLDLFAESGQNTAYSLNQLVSVTDGQLDIDFSAAVNNAKLSGIEITESGSGTVPTLKISPPNSSQSISSLNFGNVPYLQSETSEIQLTNSGSGVLDISSISISGDDSADFIITQNSPYSLGAGESETISIEFIPSANGSKSATIRIDSNDINLSHQVDLAGNGVAPDIPGGPFALRINSGGNYYIDGEGHQWNADDHYLNGGQFAVTDEILETDDDKIYQSERYGTSNGLISYSIPVPKVATYKVILHFAEIYFDYAEERIINAEVEGELIAENMDIALDSGTFRPHTVEAEVYVTDGYVDVDLSAVVQNSKISGIEVIESLHPGHPFLHVVIDAPDYAIDFDGDGFGSVQLH